MSSDKKRMDKTEIFINMIIDILNHPKNRVNEKDIQDKYDINYKTWRRYVKEMKEKFHNQEHLPIFQIIEEGEQTYIGLDKTMLKYHYPSHLETAFYFEAYKKIGYMFNHQNLSKDLEMLKDEVFQLNGRGEQLSRKFYYHSKIDGKNKNDDNQAIVVQSLIENKKLKAIYNEKEYTLYPLCLTMNRGSLYLVAFKNAMIHSNIRHYKLMRFNHIDILDEPFSYPGDHEWNPERHFKNSAGMFNDKEQQAKIRVYSPSKKIIKEKDFFNSEVISESDDSIDISVTFSNIHEFLGQCFVYAQDIEVLENDEVKKAFQEKANAALKRNKAA